MYVKVQVLEQLDLPKLARAVLQPPGFNRLHTQQAMPVTSRPVAIVGRRPIASTATAPMMVAGTSPAGMDAYT
jgi:hypothetical protein